MKVLFIDHYLWPFLKFRKAHAEFFLKRGYDVFILLGSAPGETGMTEGISGMKIIRSKVNPESKKYISLILRSFIEIYSLYREHKFDATVVYGLKQSLTRFFIPLFVPNSICIIAGFGRANKYPKRFLFFLLNFLKFYKKIFVLNNFDEKRIKNIVHTKEKVELLNSEGIKISNFSYEPARNKSIKICYIGRLIKSKGVMKAINEIKSLPHLTFDIYGPLDFYDDNEYVDIVEVSRGIPNITYFGEIDSSSSVLNNYNYMLSPSEYGEGMPFIILEAMLVGVIPIFVNIPQLFEFGKDNNIEMLQRNWSSQELEKIIFKYQSFNRDQIESFLRNNRDYVKNNYDLNKVNKRIFNSVDSLKKEYYGN